MRSHGLNGALMAAALVSLGAISRVEGEDILAWEDPLEAELRRMSRAFSREPAPAPGPTPHDLERIARAEAKRARKALRSPPSQLAGPTSDTKDGGSSPR